jgi:hypothetical protein
MQQLHILVLMDLFITSMFHQDQDGNMMANHLCKEEELQVIYR